MPPMTWSPRLTTVSSDYTSRLSFLSQENPLVRFPSGPFRQFPGLAAWAFLTPCFLLVGAELNRVQMNDDCWLIYSRRRYFCLELFFFFPTCVRKSAFYSHSVRFGNGGHCPYKVNTCAYSGGTTCS